MAIPPESASSRWRGRQRAYSILWRSRTGAARGGAMTEELLIGCDTLVATGAATADGSVLFAKNSDRHADECQHLRSYPARDWEDGAPLRCQYLAIPQARRTHAVLGGQPFWLWGFEQGVNEHGVAIGNEAIWTRAPRAETGLLGM